jgi:hypothetical protein
MLDVDAVAAALARFVKGEAELAKRTVTQRRLVAVGRVLNLKEFRELTAAVPGDHPLVLAPYGPAGDLLKSAAVRAVGLDVHLGVVLETENRGVDTYSTLV